VVNLCCSVISFVKNKEIFEITANHVALTAIAPRLSTISCLVAAFFWSAIDMTTNKKLSAVDELARRESKSATLVAMMLTRGAVLPQIGKIYSDDDRKNDLAVALAFKSRYSKKHT
jgi:hypothetical protein